MVQVISRPDNGSSTTTPLMAVTDKANETPLAGWLADKLLCDFPASSSRHTVAHYTTPPPHHHHNHLSTPIQPSGCCWEEQQELLIASDFVFAPIVHGTTTMMEDNKENGSTAP